MKWTVFLLLFCLIACIEAAFQPPSVNQDKETLKKLESKLLQLIKDDERFIIPTMVQMVFHDCVPFCDGCIDPTNPGNHGLDPTIDLIKSIRNEIAPHWSQADVNVYLGLRTLKEAAIKAGGNMQLTMKIGREDCSEPLPFRDLPFGGNVDSISFLKESFGLTDMEAVAMLGCHSLGRCSEEKSGFIGGWDRDQTALDTGYFKNMVDVNWLTTKMDNANVQSSQWGREDRLGRGPMMLNADLIALYDFDITGNFDEPTCTIDECEEAPTAKYVKLFAQDQEAFHLSLSKAMLKMVQHTGENDLQYVCMI